MSFQNFIYIFRMMIHKLKSMRTNNGLRGVSMVMVVAVVEGRWSSGISLSHTIIRRCTRCVTIILSLSYIIGVNFWENFWMIHALRLRRLQMVMVSSKGHQTCVIKNIIIRKSGIRVNSWDIINLRRAFRTPHRVIVFLNYIIHFNMIIIVSDGCLVSHYLIIVGNIRVAFTVWSQRFSFFLIEKGLVGFITILIHENVPLWRFVLFCILNRCGILRLFFYCTSSSPSSSFTHSDL